MVEVLSPEQLEGPDLKKMKSPPHSLQIFGNSSGMTFFFMLNCQCLVGEEQKGVQVTRDS